MEEVFQRLNVPFERFEAIDGDNALCSPHYASLPIGIRSGCINNEIACLLSHYEVWSLIVRRNDEYAAIFEDDIYVDDRLVTILLGSLHIPENIDILKLETNHQTPVYLGPKIHIGSFEIDIRRLLSIHRGSAGYILSKSAATWLINNLAHFDVPVDVALFSPQHSIGCRLRVYQTFPAMIVQSASCLPLNRNPTLKSSMADKRWANQPPRRNLLRRAGSRALRLAREARLRLSSSSIEVPFEGKLWTDEPYGPK